MALKAVLTKAEYDVLADPIKKEYVEKDGKFSLSVEGTLENEETKELKTKLAEFRDNNRNLFRENEELKTLKTKYDGVDPDEYKNLKAENDKLKSKGIGKADDLVDAIDKAVSKATEPLRKKLEEADREKQEAQQRFLDSEFEKQLTEIGTKKAGLRQSAVPRILSEARQKFELKDGQLVAKDGVKNADEPHKDFTPMDWFKSLAKSDSYLFEPTNGTGAEGKPGRTGAKILINPSPEEMGRHMDSIAKGETIVQRQ